MTTYTSKAASGIKPVPSVQSALAQVIPYEFTTTTALAEDDIVDLGPIPAGLEPLDVVAMFGDHDAHATPTVTMSVGLLNADKDDLDGTAWIVDSTAPQTGGVTRATTGTCYAAGSSTSVRNLGVKVTAAVATAAAVGKKILVLLTVKN